MYQLVIGTAKMLLAEITIRMAFLKNRLESNWSVNEFLPEIK